MNKYNKVMDKITVSEDARRRILRNIEKEMSQTGEITDIKGDRRKNSRRGIIRFITFYGSRAAVFMIIAVGAFAVVKTVGLKSTQETSAPETAMFEEAQAPETEQAEPELMDSMDQEMSAAEIEDEAVTEEKTVETGGMADLDDQSANASLESNAASETGSANGIGKETEPAKTEFANPVINDRGGQSTNDGVSGINKDVGKANLGANGTGTQNTEGAGNAAVTNDAQNIEGAGDMDNADSAPEEVSGGDTAQDSGSSEPSGEDNTGDSSDDSGSGDSGSDDSDDDSGDDDGGDEGDRPDIPPHDGTKPADDNIPYSSKIQAESVSELSDKMGHNISEPANLSEMSEATEYYYCSDGSEIIYQSELGTMKLYASEGGGFTGDKEIDFDEYEEVDYIDTGSAIVEAYGEDGDYDAIWWTDGEVSYILIPEESITEVDIITLF